MKLHAVTALLFPLLFFQIPANVSTELPHFTVKSQSKLAALAHLGRITHSSLLIEASDMDFLSAHVSLSEHHKSLDELIVLLLKGQERYSVRQQGRLTVIYPLNPKHPLNRILTVQLHHFRFNGGSISSLSPNLAFEIMRAIGCRPQGFGYAGPPMYAGIPAFDLSNATFEDVVAQAANGVVPTMWVVMPDSGESGCISNPGSMWEVGIYDKEGSQHPFNQAIGPQVVQ